MEATADVEVPEALVPSDRLAALMAERQPQYVHLSEASTSTTAAGSPGATDAATGITQLRLSNGIKVNYRHTDNEPKGGLFRLVAAGGRSVEGSHTGHDGAGAVAVGTRALSETGTVGDWERQQVRVYGVRRVER